MVWTRKTILCLVFFLPAVGLAKPEVGSILSGVELPYPLHVEVQGGVGAHSDDALEAVYRVANIALKMVSGYGPAGVDHFFSKKPGLFGDRAFSLILTDSPVVRFPGGEHRVSDDFEAVTVAAFEVDETNAPTKEHLIAVLRVDRLLFLSDGKFHPHAFYRVVVSLMTQLFGFWQEHLNTPLPALVKAARAGDAMERAVTRRAIGYLENLLASPRVLQEQRAGDFYGAVFHGWMEQKDKLARLTGELPGPFGMPYTVDWSRATLKAMTPEQSAKAHWAFYRALHLVHAIRPAKQKTVFDKVPAAEQRSLLLSVMDSTDKVGRAGLPGIVGVDVLTWNFADTFCLAERGGSGQMYRTILWTDRIFYDKQRVWDEDALAKAAVSLAGELYGGVGKYLGSKSIGRNPTPLEQVLLSERAYSHSVGFVDDLRQHALWKSLTEQEQQAFFRVRGVYVEQLNQLACAKAILTRAN